MTTQQAESIAQVISDEWEQQHAGVSRSNSKYRKFASRINTIAQRIREGKNEYDTVQLTGCSWKLYRRVAAAVAAEPDVYVNSDPLR